MPKTNLDLRDLKIDRMHVDPAAFVGCLGLTEAMDVVAEIWSALGAEAFKDVADDVIDEYADDENA